ncbi:P-loop ATPase, Sll1717 family [Mucilaginibacter ginkgonis]|uniref:Uncharacterized protein n=1 Tax=Mucilaginibacter ginkgonis TaxID=2682091 RepID=A0A6I4HXN7_9SPHI|nr:hypothetical protein [Mucilaginibacter ginkgonis]QQL49333.1 hypothetical protein GO620_014315 [Mucilaginibacter ginkgonis]
MSLEEYWKSLGFLSNPFQFSNADKEVEFLSEYFIKPDYFEDVWGDPYNPVSNIIYAPRGGGKTAQRIMIEKRAKLTDDILTITYTNHDLSQVVDINHVDLQYHLTYLNRLMLLAFFSRIETDDLKFAFAFNLTERQYIYKLARIYLYETPASFPNQAIASLKTISDHAIGLWNNFKEPIANIIRQISKAKGIEIDLSKVEIDKKLVMSHKDNFMNISSLLRRVGYKSLMVLIDKVDEQSLTGNNPEASFKLIEVLLKDLELIETPFVSFKFFLWDAIKQYTVVAARPDRVFPYDLKWTWSQMQEMLNQRVKSYSKGKVTEFLSLVPSTKMLGRIILFSELSPRDCIRICNRILSEQFKTDPTSKVFTEDVINQSLEIFCKEKAQELITNANNLRYLTKTNRVSFTIEDLVKNKVASDSPAVRNIIYPWTTAGYLKKIGLQSRKHAKAVNEYAFQDIRLAYMACPTLTIEEFVRSKAYRCRIASCREVFYRDFDSGDYTCPQCNTAAYS